MSTQRLRAAWIEAHNWTCAHDGEGLAAAEAAFEAWVDDQPLGYDVLMDLMHKIVASVRKDDIEAVNKYASITHELTLLYPEAEAEIQKRWGPHD